VAKLVRITGLEYVGKVLHVPLGCVKRRSINQDCVWVDRRRKLRILRRALA
jgi:hypothetical protein